MHRRGGAGLAAFDRQQQSQRGFAELSSALSLAQREALTAQMTQFRSALQHFASTHRDTIRTDALFRRDFHRMCLAIGVDPLAGPVRGGWWADALGAAGDWTFELGVQIVDVCVSTRARNGGLVEMGALLRLLGALRGVGAGGAGAITEDDVVRSIRTLAPLGAGYEVVQIGERKMVRSVRKELDEDQAVVLALAQETGGRVVEGLLVDRRGWTRERARAALENTLIRDGLCWLDDQDETDGQAYWVPSAMQWSE